MRLRWKLPAKPTSRVCARITKITSATIRDATASLWFVTAWGGQAAGEVASKMGVDILLIIFGNEVAVPEMHSGNGQSSFWRDRKHGQRYSVGEPDNFSGRTRAAKSPRYGAQPVAALVRGKFTDHWTCGRQPGFIWSARALFNSSRRTTSLVMEQDAARIHHTLEQAQKSEDAEHHSARAGLGKKWLRRMLKAWSLCPAMFC